MVWGTYIMTCIHHSSITPSMFTGLKILCTVGRVLSEAMLCDVHFWNSEILLHLRKEGTGLKNQDCCLFCLQGSCSSPGWCKVPPAFSWSLPLHTPYLGWETKAIESQYSSRGRCCLTHRTPPCFHPFPEPPALSLGLCR